MKKSQAQRVKRIQEAMIPLIGDSRFQEFVEEVREQQKGAIADAVSERVVSSERLSLAAIGELRFYENILSFYDSQVEQIEASTPQD